MARNQEKANGMFNRWVQGKKDAAAPVRSDRRPFLAAEVTTVPECERWRTQIIRQIAKNVGSVQNGSLGEHKIRDLNDQINKLMREKRAWEHQIKSLGGADYLRGGHTVTDSNGERALGTDGYFYFGAARELPGVRELFERQVAVAPKRSRVDLSKLVDADYYGYRDEDDGKLVKLEEIQEKLGRELAVKVWAQKIRAQKRQRLKAASLTLAGTTATTKKKESKDNEDDEDDEDTVDDDDDIDDATLVAQAEKGELSLTTTTDITTSDIGTAAAGATRSSSSPGDSIITDDPLAGTPFASTKILQSHVELPSDEQIAKAVLDKRKADLLAKYGNAASSGAKIA